MSLIFQSQTRMMHGVMVSVTKVRVSPDLSICTAYLSVFPSEKGEEILKNINANEKTIRFDLGKDLNGDVIDEWTVYSIGGGAISDGCRTGLLPREGF